MLSLEKTAKVLGVTLPTIHRWIDKGILPQPREVKVAGSWGKKYPKSLVRIMNELMIELGVKGKKTPYRFMVALDFRERLKQRLEYGRKE